MRTNLIVASILLARATLAGAAPINKQSQRHERWPKQTHQVAWHEYDSTRIGTNRSYVVEVDKVPVFIFEQGAGNGFPQDPKHDTHSWLKPINGYKPAMLNQEIALIQSYLHPDATMLEWGSGGSTMFYSSKVKNYYSIEHNADWAKLVGDTAVKRGMHNVNIRHVKANEKRTTSGTRENEFVSYCSAVQEFGVRRFDFVLIDGRARQFCAKSILPFVDERSRIFVHDFPMRTRYFSVLDDFFVVASVLENGAKDKGLVVLQPRSKDTR